MQITAVQAQLDNGTTLLSGKCPRMVYDQSVFNGLKMNYPVWNQQNLTGSETEAAIAYYGCGGLVLIDPALDLSLWQETKRTNCSAGKYTLNFTVNWRNATGSTIVPQLYLYAYIINDAILLRNGRNYTTSLISLNTSQVEQGMSNHARFVDQKMYEDAQYMNLFLSAGNFEGGGFRDHFRKAFQHAVNAGAYAYANRDKIINAAKVANNLYKTYKGGEMDHEDDMTMYYQ